MIGLVSRSLAAALGATALIFGGAIVVGSHISVPGRNGTSTALSVVLIVLAILDWVPVALCWRLVHRAPTVIGLQDQLSRLLFEALCASLLGAIGLNYMLGSPLPRGAGFVLLVAAVLLVSAPPLHWLIRTYWRP